MDRDSFDQVVQVFKKRVPFKPFTIALLNGDRLEVDYPDALMVRGGVAFYLGANGVPVLFDHEGVNQFIGDLMGQENPEQEKSP